MERLTKWSSDTSHENGVCCTHFKGLECFSVNGNCSMGCPWEEAAWERLASYEDTNLLPEQVDVDHEAAETLRDLCQYCDLDRLEELARADKDGRVVVLPCKVGDKLYRVFDGKISEHRVGSMRYLVIQGRWDIDTTPFCSYVESSIGKTIFLTREEAEKALEAKLDD